MRVLPLAALLLAGCATVERGPYAAEARRALPPAFALLDQERATAGNLVELLPAQDAAFVELERRALADAPTVAAALARIDAARAGLRLARAERLPNIGASSSVTQQRNNPRANFGGSLPPGIAIDPDQTAFQLGIDASFDADLFGRLRAGQRAAGARTEAAGADAAGVRLALTTDIARAVIDFRTLDARAAVIARDLQSAGELARLTQVRVRAGIAAEFDLVRARSLEADARARSGPVAAERAAIVGRLVTLTGRPAQEVLAALAAPALGQPGFAVPGPVLSVSSLVLRRRPDVAAAERRLIAADWEVAAAAADRFPRLSISAALGLFALAAGDLFDSDAIIGSVGIGLAGPLLDFGRVNARIQARQAETREAFAEYRRALFTALGETESALGQITAADARVLALNAKAALDRDAAGLARERYRRGLDTFLTVIDAERTANASNEAATDARGEAARVRVALYRAVGGDSSRHAGPWFGGRYTP